MRLTRPGGRTVTVSLIPFTIRVARPGRQSRRDSGRYPDCASLCGEDQRSRFNNSIALAKSSWRVLREDKQLAVLPLLSAIATILVMLTLLVPVALVSHERSSGGGWTAKPVDWVRGFGGYLAVTCAVLFVDDPRSYALTR